MTTQDVRVTNNDVGCGLIILLVGLVIAAAGLTTRICDRLEGIEKAIRKTEPTTTVREERGSR
jgi:hypothetical protein